MNRRQQRSRAAPLAVLAALALTSCAAIDPLLTADLGIDWSRRPADFPQDLKIVVKGRTHKDVRNSPCETAMQLTACAAPDFCKHECPVWIDYETQDWHIARQERHEIDGHCRGYDHHGENTVASWWAAYKADPIGYCKERQ